MLGAAAAGAEGDRVSIELTVSMISEEAGKIDPRAEKLVEKLKSKIRFESLKLIETKELDLGIDDVGGATLPNGKSVRVKPLLVDDKGALLAVVLEGSLDTQLRVKSDHLVVLGPQRYGDGQLVVSLEPHF